jgi:methionyl-tRNA synthetase
MREVSFGQDGNYSIESMTDRHNADLANGLGNLTSRILAMLDSYFGGEVPAAKSSGAESDLPDVTADAARRYDQHMLAIELQPGLQAVWSVVDRVNGYLVEKEPWKLAKDDANRDELAGVLYTAAEALRILAILIHPIMPGAAQRLWDQLGIEGAVADRRLPADAAWGGLLPGSKTARGEALFPRLEDR